MEEIISPKQGIIKILIYTLNTHCVREDVVEMMGCSGSQPNVTTSFQYECPIEQYTIFPA